jgi:hypothetical protein
MEVIDQIYGVHMLVMVGENVFFEIGAGQHMMRPFQHHIFSSGCGGKIRTLQRYSPGTGIWGYFDVIHCIDACANDQLPK